MEERKLENTLYSSIARLYHKNRCFMDEQLRKRGITELGFSHIRIIIILHVFKVLSMKEVTEKISKDKSTVTILVNKLEKKGYLRKKVCEEDRRVTYLELEEKAKEILNIIFEVSDIFQNRVENILDEEERKMFIKIMSKLIENWE
ncbi:MAG: MarR family winged helix-turn-helix transcriptional regulator [Fusobacterium sp.]|uniref:MarR family winged helix-turn-helix transcriptional regulator n=1 Tax=Fusobacterium sp. TaxID=68766 RepID=UPI0025CCCAE3|nr:MarR family transcriptional regulator [Fusobacterium sp.]MDY3058519.1 MarR family transcriptional regulator [Fusobacterium sp.]MEE1475207.1 MarR family transcriptional regulator [Fusobacterium sp.]